MRILSPMLLTAIVTVEISREPVSGLGVPRLRSYHQAELLTELCE